MARKSRKFGICLATVGIIAIACLAFNSLKNNNNNNDNNLDGNTPITENQNQTQNNQNEQSFLEKIAYEKFMEELKYKLSYDNLVNPNIVAFDFNKDGTLDVNYTYKTEQRDHIYNFQQTYNLGGTPTNFQEAYDLIKDSTFELIRSDSYIDNVVDYAQYYLRSSKMNEEVKKEIFGENKTILDTKNTYVDQLDGLNCCFVVKDEITNTIKYINVNVIPEFCSIEMMHKYQGKTNMETMAFMIEDGLHKKDEITNIYEFSDNYGFEIENQNTSEDSNTF